MKTFNPTELNFSESAIEHFNNSLKKRGYGNGIQIGVRKAGCSGYEYFFDFVDEVDNDHILYEKSKCKIYVEIPYKKNYEFQINTPINWELLKSKKSGEVAYLLFQHNISVI